MSILKFTCTLAAAFSLAAIVHPTARASGNASSTFKFKPASSDKDKVPDDFKCNKDESKKDCAERYKKSKQGERQ